MNNVVSTSVIFEYLKMCKNYYKLKLFPLSMFFYIYHLTHLNETKPNLKYFSCYMFALVKLIKIYNKLKNAGNLSIFSQIPTLKEIFKLKNKIKFRRMLKIIKLHNLF